MQIALYNITQVTLTIIGQVTQNSHSLCTLTDVIQRLNYTVPAERNPALPGSFSYEPAFAPSPSCGHSHLTLFINLIHLKCNVTVIIKKIKLQSLNRNFNDMSFQ